MPSVAPPSTRLAAVLVAAAALAGACARGRSADPYTRVTGDDVARMIGDPRVAIVDANPYEIFQEGHVPGARWYRSGPTLAAALPADRATRLVFYCASPG